MIDINKRLEAAKKQGDIGEYQMRLIQELLLRVSDRLLAGFQTIKKGGRFHYESCHVANKSRCNF